MLACTPLDSWTLVLPLPTLWQTRAGFFDSTSFFVFLSPVVNYNSVLARASSVAHELSFPLRMTQEAKHSFASAFAQLYISSILCCYLFVTSPYTSLLSSIYMSLRLSLLLSLALCCSYSTLPFRSPPCHLPLTLRIIIDASPSTQQATHRRSLPWRHCSLKCCRMLVVVILVFS